MHELTEKMRQRDIKSDRWDDVDSIIRAYLSEKAKELVKSNRLANWDKNKAREAAFEILGLSSSKEVGEPVKLTGPATAFNVPKPKDSENHTDGPNCVPCQKRGEKLINSWEPKDSERYQSAWCSHVVLDEEGEYWIPLGEESRAQIKVQKEYQFCPICGNPRPTPKTLAEKFRDCGSGRQRNTIAETTDFYSELANIAEKHFKESK